MLIQYIFNVCIIFFVMNIIQLGPFLLLFEVSKILTEILSWYTNMFPVYLEPEKSLVGIHNDVGSCMLYNNVALKVSTFSPSLVTNNTTVAIAKNVQRRKAIRMIFKELEDIEVTMAVNLISKFIP